MNYAKTTIFAVVLVFLIMSATDKQFHVTNECSCGNRPEVCVKIRERQFRLLEHCAQHSEEEVSKLVLWVSRHGMRRDVVFVISHPLTI